LLRRQGVGCSLDFSKRAHRDENTIGPSKRQGAGSRCLHMAGLELDSSPPSGYAPSCMSIST
jgi:hypothetical protein